MDQAFLSRRVAQLLAIKLTLIADGWHVEDVSSTDGNRRPLCLPGERMGQPLDGALSDQRAQGFTAWWGGSGRRSDACDLLSLDACAGLPVVVLVDRGHTTAVHDALDRFLLDSEPAT